MSTGLKANSDGSAAIQVGGSDVITLTSGGAATFLTSPTTVQAGTAAAPSITFSGDTNTGIYSPAADTIAFTEGGVESMRIDSAGNVGLGATPSAWNTSLRAEQFGARGAIYYDGGYYGEVGLVNNGYWAAGSADNWLYTTTATAALYRQRLGEHHWLTAASGTAGNTITFTERARIDSSGRLMVGTTTTASTVNGLQYFPGTGANTESILTLVNERTDGGGETFLINRQASDGTLIQFRQANTTEGTISVSGTTVTYGGGHLARFAQLLDSLKDETLLKGTVLTNLDEMCVWINKETGEPVDNEQCNKVKVSEVEGDASVAGVFVSWTYDEQFDTNDLFVAMTGDMIIRIAQGVTVQKGDLLMSAGDGTAKPQGDDIIRSKTIAKVTSNHVTCTYEDGSYCVPCVLMAC